MEAFILLVLGLDLLQFIEDRVFLTAMLAQSVLKLALEIVQLVYLARQYLAIHFVGLELQVFLPFSLILHVLF
jgi:hypothetical protein